MRTVKSDIVDVELTRTAGQNTYRAELVTHQTKIALGSIAWDPKWSKYVFIPPPGARYTLTVLTAIQRQLGILMRAWQRQDASNPRPRRPNKRNSANRHREKSARCRHAVASHS